MNVLVSLGLTVFSFSRGGRGRCYWTEGFPFWEGPGLSVRGGVDGPGEGLCETNRVRRP